MEDRVWLVLRPGQLHTASSGKREMHQLPSSKLLSHGIGMNLSYALVHRDFGPTVFADGVFLWGGLLLLLVCWESGSFAAALMAIHQSANLED